MRPGLTVLLTALLLAGCGGSGDDRLTKSEFIAEADAICAKGRDHSKALPEPTTYAELAEYIRKGISIQDHDVAEIRKLKPPKNDAQDVELMLEQVERLNAAFDRLQAAAEKGDAKGVVRRSTDVRRANRAAARRARQYGLRVCGQPLKSIGDST